MRRRRAPHRPRRRRCEGEGERQRRQAQGARRLIELRTFRLREGADEGAFLAADARFQTDVVYQQPGIARRTTSRNVDGGGEWLVVTLWNELADAEAAPASSPELDALIDPTSVVVRRYEELPG